MIQLAPVPSRSAALVPKPAPTKGQRTTAENQARTGRILGVVQARMSSRRFPGKMLAPLAGRPLIEHVLRRLARATAIDEVVLATSDHADDDVLADAVAALGYAVVRGPLDDVLGRYLLALDSHDCAAVVRVTGDCPLLDPAIVDQVVALWREAGGYASNVTPPSFPDGLDVEVVAASALRTAAAEAKEPHEREHVTPFIRERPGRFGAAVLRCPAGDRSDLHWSVDRPEDLALVGELLAACTQREPGLDDLLAILDARADLHARSLAVKPNEGAVATFKRSQRARAPRPRTAASDAWWERAQAVIPAGTQTLSKAPSQYCKGFGPKYLVRGSGCHVWDADGNKFIDYPMGLGPVTLGHGHPEVVQAVADQLSRGTAFSLMHPLEVEVAEMVRERVPCAEMVRFGKNGSDATSACIRGARALTGRDHIARCGYHGWQDWSIDANYGIRAKGVPQAVRDLTHPFAFNDLNSLEQALTKWPCAAVILEPVGALVPQPGFLAGVRALCDRHGALLVFDEVISGFRHARGGAQQHFGVTPDLCAMGKGLANGLPLAVVAGRKDCMKIFDEVFFSFTFGGEVTALAAAKATLQVMDREDYWNHAWRLGGVLQQAYQDLAIEFGFEGRTRCAGLPPWTVVIWDDGERWTGLQLKTLFQQEMLARGVLFSGSQFLCLAHDDEAIAATIAAYREAFRVLAFARDTHSVDQLLEGAVNEVVFRRA